MTGPFARYRPCRERFNGLTRGLGSRFCSLEDLVRRMFDSDRSRPPDGPDARTEPPETHGTGTVIDTRPPAPGPVTPTVPRMAAARPVPRRAATDTARARARTYALAGAIAVLGSLGGWQVLADAPVTTSAAPLTSRTGSSASVPLPLTQPQAAADPQAEAAVVLPATAPEPGPGRTRSSRHRVWHSQTSRTVGESRSLAHTDAPCSWPYRSCSRTAPGSSASPSP